MKLRKEGEGTGLNSGSILPGTVGRVVWLAVSMQEAASYANEASVQLKQSLIPETPPRKQSCMGRGTPLGREGLLNICWQTTVEPDHLAAYISCRAAFLPRSLAWPTGCSWAGVDAGWEGCSAGA